MTIKNKQGREKKTVRWDKCYKDNIKGDMIELIETDMGGLRGLL